MPQQCAAPRSRQGMPISAPQFHCSLPQNANGVCAQQLPSIRSRQHSLVEGFLGNHASCFVESRLTQALIRIQGLAARSQLLNNEAHMKHALFDVPWNLQRK
eukprot:4420586-Amphidinium_carterae.1